MIDPLGGFQRIRDLYITYLETAFRIDDPQVSTERRRLLEAIGTLCSEPFVEPITRYINSRWSLHDLVSDEPLDDRLPGLTAKERLAFAELALSGLFESVVPPTPTLIRFEAAFPVYEHQAMML